MSARIVGAMCVRCQGAIESGGVACTACGARHHATCYGATGRCTSCECAKLPCPFSEVPPAGDRPFTVVAVLALALVAPLVPHIQIPGRGEQVRQGSASSVGRPAARQVKVADSPSPRPVVAGQTRQTARQAPGRRDARAPDATPGHIVPLVGVPRQGLFRKLWERRFHRWTGHLTLGTYPVEEKGQPQSSFPAPPVSEQLHPKQAEPGQAHAHPIQQDPGGAGGPRTRGTRPEVDCVFVGGEESLTAVNARTGELVWETPQAGGAWLPLASKRRLFVHEGTDVAATGALRFGVRDTASGVRTGGFETRAYGLTSQVITADYLVYTHLSGRLACRSVEDLRTLWDIYLPADRCINASGNRLYVHARDGFVHCVDLATGRAVWKRRLDGTGPDCRPTPLSVAANTRAAVVAVGKNAIAFDARNGAVLWRTATAAPVTGASMAVTDDHVLVCLQRGLLSCIDARSGATRWTVRYAPSRSLCPLPPTLVGPYAVVRSGEDLVAFDAIAGREVWREKLGPHGSSPETAGRAFYVSVLDRIVAYALRE